MAATPDELTSLLTECHSAWVSTRQSLLGSRVAEEIGRMEPTKSDLVDLVSRSHPAKEILLMADPRWL